MAHRRVFVCLAVAGILVPIFYLTVSSTLAVSAATLAAQSGGAHIEKPYRRDITGAECFTSPLPRYAGDVNFSFPSRGARQLGFSIGPMREGHSPGQENNRPYSGPGQYTNIGIAGVSDGIIGQSKKGLFLGMGTVTINPDGQTGSFRLHDGSASGTFDCGAKIH